MYKCVLSRLRDKVLLIRNYHFLDFRVFLTVIFKFFGIVLIVMTVSLWLFKHFPCFVTSTTRAISVFPSSSRSIAFSARFLPGVFWINIYVGLDSIQSLSRFCLSFLSSVRINLLKGGKRSKCLRAGLPLLTHNFYVPALSCFYMRKEQEQRDYTDIHALSKFVLFYARKASDIHVRTHVE